MNRPRPLLLVEDNPDDAFFFKRQIDAIGGFEVYLVGSARAAIRFLQSAREIGPLPNAVFVDLRLPDMSGLEFLDWLKHRPEFAGIARYAVSDPVTMPDVELGACGIREMLAKPVTAQTLAPALAKT